MNIELFKDLKLLSDKYYKSLSITNDMMNCILMRNDKQHQKLLNSLDQQMLEFNNIMTKIRKNIMEL